MSEKSRLTDKPRKLKEIASWYSVSTKTMSRWLSSAGLLNTEGRYYYTIPELEQITAQFGEPTDSNF